MGKFLIHTVCAIEHILIYYQHESENYEKCLDIYYLINIFYFFDNLILVRIFFIDRAIQILDPSICFAM